MKNGVAWYFYRHSTNEYLCLFSDMCIGCTSFILYPEIPGLNAVNYPSSFPAGSHSLPACVNVCVEGNGTIYRGILLGCECPPGQIRVMYLAGIKTLFT